jgi:hypothetical protein
METRFREDVGDPTSSEIGSLKRQMKYPDGGYTISSDTRPSVQVRQERRRCWDELHPGPPYTSGGPFRLIKADDGSAVTEIGVSCSDMPLGSPEEYTWFYTYDGGFQIRLNDIGLDPANIDNIGISGPYGPDYSDPSSYGASAWNRFAPELEFGQLGLMVAEARDLPRMFKTTARAFHEAWKALGGKGTTLLTRNSIGDNFLNHQFGWLPFVADIKKLISVTKQFERHYMQLKRDNGQFVRRSGTFSSSLSSVHSSVTNFGAVDTFISPCAILPSSMFTGPVRGTAS